MLQLTAHFSVWFCDAAVLEVWLAQKQLSQVWGKDPIQAQNTWFCCHKQVWKLSSGVALTNVETLLKYETYYRNVDMICMTQTNVNVFVVCRNFSYQHVIQATPLEVKTLFFFLSFWWTSPLSRWRSDCNSQHQWLVPSWLESISIPIKLYSCWLAHFFHPQRWK